MPGRGWGGSEAEQRSDAQRTDVGGTGTDAGEASAAKNDPLLSLLTEAAGEASRRTRMIETALAKVDSKRSLEEREALLAKRQQLTNIVATLVGCLASPLFADATKSHLDES